MAARINRVSTIPAMAWTCRLAQERLKMSPLLTLTLTQSGWPRTLRMVTSRPSLPVPSSSSKVASPSACMWRAIFVPLRSWPSL